jgi:hypothetical protein
MSDNEGPTDTRQVYAAVEKPSTSSGGKGGLTKGDKSKTSYNRSEIGIEELRGYIFTYGTQSQQSNYIRTKRALSDHVGTTFKFAKELYKALNGGKEVELMEPEKPTSAKPTQIEVKRQEDEERRSNDSGRSSRSNNSSQGWFSENPRSGMSSFQYMERSAWDQEY